MAARVVATAGVTMAAAVAMGSGPRPRPGEPFVVFFVFGFRFGFFPVFFRFFVQFFFFAFFEFFGGCDGPGCMGAAAACARVQPIIPRPFDSRQAPLERASTGV